MLITSPKYQAALAAAEDQIRSDLRAGAIDEYLDADSAVQILGNIVKMHQGEPGKAAFEIDCEIGVYLQETIDQIVENNVHRVAEENAK